MRRAAHPLRLLRACPAFVCFRTIHACWPLHVARIVCDHLPWQRWASPRGWSGAVVLRPFNNDGVAEDGQIRDTSQQTRVLLVPSLHPDTYAHAVRVLPGSTRHSGELTNGCPPPTLQLQQRFLSQGFMAAMSVSVDFKGDSIIIPIVCS